MRVPRTTPGGVVRKLSSSQESVPASSVVTNVA
jgi:hypothetical protein